MIHTAFNYSGSRIEVFMTQLLENYELSPMTTFVTVYILLKQVFFARDQHTVYTVKGLHLFSSFSVFVRLGEIQVMGLLILYFSTLLLKDSCGNSSNLFNESGFNFDEGRSSLHTIFQVGF